MMKKKLTESREKEKKWIIRAKYHFLLGSSLGENFIKENDT